MMQTRRQFHARVPRPGRRQPGLCLIAQAGDYPNRPIKIIVPFAAGGGPDVLTRKMASSWPRCSARAASWWWTTSSAPAASRGPERGAHGARRLQPPAGRLLAHRAEGHGAGVKFDPMKDFTHITRTAFTPSILVVSAASPYKTVEDLVAARKEPGQAQLRLRRRRQRGAPVRRGDGAAGEDRRRARAVQGLGGNRALDPARRHAVRDPDRLDRDSADPGRQGARARRDERAAHAGACRTCPRSSRCSRRRISRSTPGSACGRRPARRRRWWTSCSRRWSRPTTTRRCAPTARRPAPSSRSAVPLPSSRSSWKPRP